MYEAQGPNSCPWAASVSGEDCGETSPASGCDVCAGGCSQGFGGAELESGAHSKGIRWADPVPLQPHSVPDPPLHPLGKAAFAPPQPGAPASPPRSCPQIVSSASTDLQDYTYYFVPAPWLSVKLLRLLQCYPPPGTADPRAGTWGLWPAGQAGGAVGLCWVFSEAASAASPVPWLQGGQP